MDRRTFLTGLMGGLIAAGCGTAKTAAAPSETDVQEFFSALQDGDTEIVRRLLQAKPGLANAKNANGQTPLQIAKQKGHEELVDLLKKHGATE